MDIKANLLSQAIWSYAPESVSLFSFYFEGTKLAAFFTKTKHIRNIKKLVLSVNIHNDKSKSRHIFMNRMNLSNRYWVFYICVSFGLLAHEPRDSIYQAETKIIVVTS